MKTVLPRLTDNTKKRQRERQRKIQAVRNLNTYDKGSRKEVVNDV